MFEVELEKWIGGLILAGFGSVCTGFFAAAKLIWHLSKVDSKIESAHQMAIRAHKRLDKLENDETR